MEEIKMILEMNIGEKVMCKIIEKIEKKEHHSINMIREEIIKKIEDMILK